MADKSLVAASPVAAMWPDELLLRYIDGRDWEIRADFRFANPSDRFPSFVIPAGTLTDFASIPRLLWPAISPTEYRIAYAAVTHDRIYRTPTMAITRKQADRVLRDGMTVLGARWHVRWSVWAAVRAWGWLAYQRRTV